MPISTPLFISSSYSRLSCALSCYTYPIISYIFSSFSPLSLFTMSSPISRFRLFPRSYSLFISGSSVSGSRILVAMSRSTLSMSRLTVAFSLMKLPYDARNFSRLDMVTFDSFLSWLSGGIRFKWYGVIVVDMLHNAWLGEELSTSQGRLILFYSLMNVVLCEDVALKQRGYLSPCPPPRPNSATPSQPSNDHHHFGKSQVSLAETC